MLKNVFIKTRVPFTGSKYRFFKHCKFGGTPEHQVLVNCVLKLEIWNMGLASGGYSKKKEILKKVTVLEELTSEIRVKICDGQVSNMGPT